MRWFKQAVTGPDNKTFEGAYLALAAIIALVILTIFSMLILAGVEIGLCDRKLQKECFNPAGLGGGIAAAIAAVGAFLGGVGAFIALDRKPSEAPTTTTTESQSTVVKTIAPAAANGVAQVGTPIQDVGRVEPMPAKIGLEDVGKKPLLSGTKRKRKGKK